MFSRYERSQLVVGSARLQNKRVTTSVAVNTDRETAMDAGHEEDRSRSSTGASSPPSRSERQTDSSGASVGPGSKPSSFSLSKSVPDTSGLQRSSASSGPARSGAVSVSSDKSAAPDGQSFAELVRELADAVVETIAWAKIAVPACWARAVVIWRATCRAFYSQRLRSRIEYVAGLAGRVAALDTDVDPVSGVTKVSLRLAPA